MKESSKAYPRLARVDLTFADNPLLSGQDIDLAPSEFAYKLLSSFGLETVFATDDSTFNDYLEVRLRNEGDEAALNMCKHELKKLGLINLELYAGCLPSILAKLIYRLEVYMGRKI